MEEAQTRITKWKAPIWKGYMLYGFNYMTFQKRKRHVGSWKKKSEVSRHCGEGGMNRQSTDDF